MEMVGVFYTQHNVFCLHGRLHIGTPVSRANFASLMKPFMESGTITVVGEATSEALALGLGTKPNFRRLSAEIKLEAPEGRSLRQLQLDRVVERLSYKANRWLTSSMQRLPRDAAASPDLGRDVTSRKPIPHTLASCGLSAFGSLTLRRRFLPDHDEQKSFGRGFDAVLDIRRENGAVVLA